MLRSIGFEVIVGLDHFCDIEPFTKMVLCNRVCIIWPLGGLSTTHEVLDQGIRLVSDRHYHKKSFLMNLVLSKMLQ